MTMRAHDRRGYEATALAAPRCLVAVTGDAALAGRIAATLADAGMAPSRPVTSIEHLLRGAGPLDTDVVVLGGDVRRPALAAQLRSLHHGHPSTPVVVVSPGASAVAARRAINAGASGMVDADALESALAPTVHAVHAGQVCAPRDGRRAVAKPSFSPRERQVIALVTTGATNSQIAAQLYLSESTVKSHLASLFNKLGVRSRNDMVAIVLDPEEGLHRTALLAALPGPAEVA